MSEDDLQTAAHHVKEGRERVDALTASIMDARKTGQSTHLSETALITMLINLERLRRCEGDSRISPADTQQRYKKGDVWACAKDDTTEGTQNMGNAVAIMRIIDLMTA